MTTKAELAAQLSGNEYRSEITKLQVIDAKAAGLVVIFGASDDLIELRGAIDDEVGAYTGTTIYLHRGGVLADPEQEDCGRCAKRLKALRKKCHPVRCQWDEWGYLWFISVRGIDFAPFDILEGVKKFCRGIVIDVNDLPEVDVE